LQGATTAGAESNLGSSLYYLQEVIMVKRKKAIRRIVARRKLTPGMKSKQLLNKFLTPDERKGLQHNQYVSLNHHGRSITFHRNGFVTETNGSCHYCIKVLWERSFDMPWADNMLALIMAFKAKHKKFMSLIQRR